MRPTEPVRRPELDRRERRLRDQLRLLDGQVRRLRRESDDAAAARRRREDEARARRSADLEDQLLTWAVPATALLALPLAVGHLAALLVHGGTPSYPLREAPGILARLAAHPGDPGAAWRPVNTGTQVPGPLAWWGTLALLVVLGLLTGLLVWAFRRTPARRPPGAWAPWPAIRHLWAQRPEDHRLVVGTIGGRRVGLRGRHSLLVLGPAHTGKTSGLAIPAVLEWSGPAVVATSKGHLVDQTIGWRSRKGEVHLFDPAAITRYHRSGWSVLADCGTWQGAMRTAADLTAAARAATAGSRTEGAPFAGGGDLWRSSMAVSLAPYLLAAVSSGRSIRAVIEWIEREERDEVLDILAGVDRTATRAHRTTFTRPDADRASFLHGMQQILSVFQDPVVSPSMDRHEIVPDELLDGGAHTLYLTAPEHDQARFRPLCAMVLRQVLAAAYERSAQLGRPLDEPLLVVLDDAGSIAPVDDLASLASTAEARGVQLVSIFQDPSQIAARHGDASGLVVRNHAAKLVLPPGARAASPSATDDLLPAELAGQLRRFEAALLYDLAAPAKVALRPWFRDKELTRRVTTPQDAVEPAEDAPDADRPDPVEQAATWLRRAGRGQAADDGTIPLDTDDPDYVAVFGRVEEDELPPTNVTPLTERWRRS